MSRTRIKICGLTRAEDVDAAVSAGADACGFVFAPSARQVSIEEASALCDRVPPPVGRIGVFVDADEDEVLEAITDCQLTAVQFAGDESPGLCARMPVPVVKVLKVGTNFAFEMAEPFRGRAAALLLDTFVAGKAGGTSQVFDWHSLGRSPEWASLYVAGGLNPENVAECVRTLRPFAVDVSSGVEREPGVKDHDKIRLFCSAVAEADREDTR